MADFFDSKSMTVQWSEADGHVVLRWKGFAQGDDYREGMNKVIELLEAQKASRWLIDAREMSVITQVDQTWIVEDWHPRAVAAGLRKVAVVLPASAIAQMSLNRLENSFHDLRENPVATAYFPDPAEARAWLRG